jgi:hypothetical protein
MLRSTELPEALAPEIRETEYICRSFLAGLSFVVYDTGRDETYINNHLLSYTAQDYLQSAISLPLLVQEGIQSVCRRELRFILEMSIKLCYVQQQDYTSPIADKVTSFKKILESTNISIQKDVTLGMIPEGERPGFYQEVGRLYGETSGYVHWTSKQILETIAAVQQGRSSGHESPDSIRQLNTLISRGLACSLVFLYHAVPSYVAGDWLVDSDGTSHDWPFAQSKYIALIDEHHDYKAERKAILAEVKKKRWETVRY